MCLAWSIDLRRDVNDFTETSPGLWRAEANFPHKLNSKNIFLDAVSYNAGAWSSINRATSAVSFNVFATDQGVVSATTTDDPSLNSDDLYQVNIMIWHEVAQPTGT